MDNRSSTPQRHETFDQGGDRDVGVATPTLSEPATFEARPYRRDSRIAHPQESACSMLSHLQLQSSSHLARSSLTRLAMAPRRLPTRRCCPPPLRERVATGGKTWADEWKT